MKHSFPHQFLLRVSFLLSCLCVSLLLCLAETLPGGDGSQADGGVLLPGDSLPPGQGQAQNDSLAVRPKGTFHEAGIASYYSARMHGRKMASGATYDRNGFFCAHKTLPFGTKVRVVNKKNGKEVVVEVQDRGPFGRGRVIDLSNKAAAEIGMLSAGIVPVELWVLP